MDLPVNPQDRDALKFWCVEQALRLLANNTGAGPDDEEAPYNLRDASFELLEQHPEMKEALLDVEDPEIVYDFTSTVLDGQSWPSADLPPRKFLARMTEAMASDVIVHYAGTSEEVKRVNQDRHSFLVR